MKSTIYRLEDGKEIKGVILYAIIDNLNFYFTEIKVYEDGLIDCWELINLETFKDRLRTEKVRVSLPPDSKLNIPNLGEIEISNFLNYKSNDDFVKEIEDVITELNGRKGRQRICIDLFKEYLIDDSDANFKKLKVAFEDLPSHQKKLFEMVDYKDPLIGLLIRGETFSREIREYMLKDYFDGE